MGRVDGPRLLVKNSVGIEKFCIITVNEKFKNTLRLSINDYTGTREALIIRQKCF